MANTSTKYPEITVSLVGTDGNAFAVMGLVSRALKRAGVSENEVDQYREESMSGDYDQLLAAAGRWVSIG